MSDEEEEAPVEETFEDADEAPAEEDAGPVTQTWGSRLKNSVSLVVIGFVIFLACIVVLWTNESDLVEQRAGLREAEAAVVELRNTSFVDPAFDGKLVHFSGHTEAGSDVTDPIFGVSMEDTLKLERTVQMYQWTETRVTTKAKDGRSNEVDYEHEKKWLSFVNPSSKFQEPWGHTNPTAMCYPKETFDAEPVTLGAYVLSDIVKDKITGLEPIPPSEIVLADVPASTKEAANAKITTYLDKGFYIGAGTNANPKIGDCRVSFKGIQEKEISVVAMMVNNSFGEFTTSNDIDVVLVEDGKKSSEEVFDIAQDNETGKANLVRLLGFLGIWIGLLMITEPFVVFMDIVPLLGEIVEYTVAILTFGVAFGISLVVIAIAWLWFRPVFSLTLFGAVFALTGGIYYLKNRKPKASLEEETPLNPDGETYTDEPED